MRPAFQFLARLIPACLLVACALTTAMAEDAPTEFRGLAFGSPLEAVSDLVPVSEAGMSRERYQGVYYREGEKLSMGKAALKSVAYYYPEGTLRSVVVVIEGDADAFLVKDQLIKQYGPGRQVGGRYGWTWPEFSLVMDRAPDRDMHTLTYTHEPRQP